MPAPVLSTALYALQFARRGRVRRQAALGDAIPVRRAPGKTGRQVGLIFFVPFFGMAVGALLGALSGHFADYGIDDGFIKEVREKITAGTSGLFLLTSDAVPDRVIEAAKTLPPFEIVATNLPKDQEQKLREAFGE